MDHILAQSAHGCVDANALVILDLDRDRYWSAPLVKAGEGSCIAGLDAGAREAWISPRSVARFSELGLVIPRNAETPLREQIELPINHAGGIVTDTSVAALWSMWASMQWSRATLAKGLQRTLGRLTAQRRDLAPSDTANRYAAAFEYLRPWHPSKRVCLLDSVALLQFLFRNNIAANLTFGVRATPFAAHCWVESQRVVLNDALEDVRAYTPIFRL